MDFSAWSQVFFAQDSLDLTHPHLHFLSWSHKDYVDMIHIILVHLHTLPCKAMNKLFPLRFSLHSSQVNVKNFMR